jgi:hypothetical protein
MAKAYLEPFVLVGGTALALQIGHRTSIDLDLFTNELFSADALYEQLGEDFQVAEPFVKDKSTLLTEIEDIKTDFIRFKYAFQRPVINMEGIRLISMEDIAPMKLDAITGRGKKKDFFDLYFLLQRFPLPQMLDWYAAMFQHNTLFHVWKSLTYFEDAESDGEPLVFDKKVTWEVVKEAIQKEVAAL